MSIRLRAVDGILIALCAVESDPKPGDVYLDDAAHAALHAKFARDWDMPFQDPRHNTRAAGEKVRDAERELEHWIGGLTP